MTLFFLSLAFVVILTIITHKFILKTQTQYLNKKGSYQEKVTAPILEAIKIDKVLGLSAKHKIYYLNVNWELLDSKFQKTNFNNKNVPRGFLKNILLHKKFNIQKLKWLNSIELVYEDSNQKPYFIKEDQDQDFNFEVPINSMHPESKLQLIYHYGSLKLKNNLTKGISQVLLVNTEDEVFKPESAFINEAKAA